MSKRKPPQGKGVPQFKGRTIAGTATAEQAVRATAKAITAPLNASTLTYDSALPVTRTRVADALQALSALAALPNLSAEQLSSLHDLTSLWFTSDKAAVKTIVEVIKGRAVAALRALQPDEVLDSGTRRYRFGGLQKELRVMRTGLDPKKVEAQLRARGAAVGTYMRAEVKYGVTSDTEQRLLDDKVFTVEELKAMKYEESYALMPSKPIFDNEQADREQGQ